MTNDDSEPPNAVVHATHGPKEQSYRENGPDMNQPQPSSPPKTPTPPSDSTPVNGTRAPEPMTLPERHQAALRHIHTLESHNAKLYDDNCRLVNAVNMLNDRLAFLGAPQNTQVHRLVDMQEKLRTSEASWALINRKYQELLQCTPAGSVQHYINEELQATREAYASLDRDYRLLGDKYVRLKAVADVNRVAQLQPQGTARGLVPAVRPEFHAHEQNQNSYISPTSLISPGPFQPLLHQQGNNRRRSFESTMVQPSLRSGPTPIATTWLAPLPTPPPSAPVPRGQASPTGFPVHASVPAGSLLLLHHPQISHESLNLSGLPAVTQFQHSVQQGASEQLNAIMPLHQRCGKITDNEPVPCGKQICAPASLTSSPRPPKRPSSQLQTSASPGGGRKRVRTEWEPERLTTDGADTHSAKKIPSPPASADPQNDGKISVADSNVRSYQECVNLIFEKDADVENGVFCGLCLDRHEAKMILEPPDVLVRPDFNFLVRHCMTMHPTVWDDLRHKA